MTDDTWRPRYRIAPVFLLALVFVVSGPVYWQLVEVRQADQPAASANLDLYQFTVPVFSHAFGRVRAGEWPLWSDAQLCGVPLGRAARVSLYQPLNLPFLFLPAERALAVQAFAALALMGFGMALFLRAAGLRFAAGFLGGAVYAFSGAAAAGMSRPAEAAAFAWAPFLAWALVELRRQPGAAWACVAGAMGGLLLLSGAWGLSAAGALVALLAWLLPAARDDGATRRRASAGWLALALVGALTASAALWAPYLAEWQGLAARWTALWETRLAGDLAREPLELLAHLITAEPDNLPRLAYVGLAPLLLALPALAHPRRHLAAAAWLALACGIGAAAFTGWSGWPAAVPREVAALPWAFAGAALAATGADALLPAREKWGAPRVWPAALLLVAGGAGWFVLAGDKARGLLLLALVVVLAGVPANRRAWSGTCVVLVALLIMADLASATRNTHRHPFMDAPAVYRRHDELMNRAAAESYGGRVAAEARPADPALGANLGMLWTLEQAGGTLWPLTADEAAWWKTLNPDAARAHPAPQADADPLLQAMAVRVYVAGPEAALPQRAGGAPRFLELYRDEDGTVALDDDALPRAFWVGQWEVVDGAEEAIAAMRRPGHDPAARCVVDSRYGVPEGAGGAMAPDAAVRCSVRDPRPEEVVVRVDAPAAGIAVLSDRWAPGWTAHIGGRPVPILRVNGLFRGVEVPEGSHAIRFAYRPGAAYAGAGVGAAAWVALAAGFAGGLWRGARRRNQSDSAPPG